MDTVFFQGCDVTKTLSSSKSATQTNEEQNRLKHKKLDFRHTVWYPQFTPIREEKVRCQN